MLGEIEDREIELAHSDRSKTPIEPYLGRSVVREDGRLDTGDQARRWRWQREVAGRAIAGRSPDWLMAMDAVSVGRVNIVPPRYAKSYLDWLSEKRDWPVSRQLWWGHRIPVWYANAMLPTMATVHDSCRGPWLNAYAEAAIADSIAISSLRALRLDDWQRRRY